MVGIYKIGEYSEQEIEKCLEKVWADLKLEEVFKDGMNVVIKADLSLAKSDKIKFSTNELLIKLVAQKTMKAGTKITICDNTDGIYSVENLEEKYKKCNLESLEDIGIELNREIELKDVTFKIDEKEEKIQLIEVLKNADYIINMPKLKVHQNFGISGAIYNMFNSINFENIKEMYQTYKVNNKISKFAYEVASMYKKQIVIMDAIHSVQGVSYNTFSEVKTNFIAASDKIEELDYFVAKNVFKNAEKLPIINELNNRQIVFSSENLKSEIKNFKNLTMPISLIKPSVLEKLSNKLVWPEINHNLCIKCQLCVSRCPMKVIAEKNYRVVMDNRYNCTKCMYCVGVCPVGAIELKKMKVKLSKKVLKQLKEAEKNENGENNNE